MSYKQSALFNAINSVSQARIDNKQMGDWYFRAPVQDNLWRGGIPKPLYEQQKMQRLADNMAKYPTSYDDMGNYIEPQDREDYVPYPKKGYGEDKYTKANKELEEILKKEKKATPSVLDKVRKKGYFTDLEQDGYDFSTEFGRDLRQLPKKMILGSENSRGGLQRLADAGTSLLSAVINPIVDMAEKSKSREYDKYGFDVNAGDGYFSSTAKDDIKDAVKSSARALKGLNIFASQIDRDDLKRTTDLLDSLGWEAEKGVQFTKPSTWSGKNIARGVTTFAGDIMLDPMSYVNYGLTGLTSDVMRGTGTKVGKTTLKPMTADLAEEALTKAGREVNSTNVAKIIKEVDKMQGIRKHRDIAFKVPFAKQSTKKHLFDNKVVQEFGDRTIAPKVNAILEVLTNPNHKAKPRLGTNVENLIDAGAKVAVAKNIPEFKFKANTNDTIAKQTAKKFNLTPKEEQQVLDIISNPGQVIHGRNIMQTEEGKKIQSYVNDIMDGVISGKIDPTDLANQGVEYDAIGKVIKPKGKAMSGKQFSLFDDKYVDDITKTGQLDMFGGVSDNVKKVSKKFDDVIGPSEQIKGQYSMFGSDKIGIEDIKYPKTSLAGVFDKGSFSKDNMDDMLGILDRATIGKTLKQMDTKDQIKYFNEHVFLEDKISPLTTKYNMDRLVDSFSNPDQPVGKSISYIFNAPERFDGTALDVDTFLADKYGAIQDLKRADNMYKKGYKQFKSEADKLIERNRDMKYLRTLNKEDRIKHMLGEESAKINKEISSLDLRDFVDENAKNFDTDEAYRFGKERRRELDSLSKADQFSSAERRKRFLDAGGSDKYYELDKQKHDFNILDKYRRPNEDPFKDGVGPVKWKNSGVALKDKHPRVYEASKETGLKFTNDFYEKEIGNVAKNIDKIKNTPEFIASDFGKKYIRTQELLNERYNHNDINQKVRLKISEIFSNTGSSTTEDFIELQSDIQGLDFMSGITTDVLGKDMTKNLLLINNPMFDKNGNQVSNKVAEFSTNLVNRFADTAEIKSDIKGSGKGNWFRDMFTPLLTKDGRNAIYDGKISTDDLVDDVGIFVGDNESLFDKVGSQKISKTLSEVNKTMKEKYGIDKFLNDDIGEIYVNHMQAKNKMMYQDESINNMLSTFGRTVKNKKTPVLDFSETAFIKSSDLMSMLGKHDEKTKQAILSDLGLDNVIKDGYAMPMIEVREKDLDKVTKLFGNGKLHILDKDVFRTASKSGLTQQIRDSNVVLDLYDKALNWYKVMTTSANPGFHSRNKMGNMAQSYINIGKEAINPKNMKQATDILNMKPGEIKLKDGSISYDEIRSAMDAYGLLDSGFFQSEFAGAMKDKPTSKKINDVINIFDTNNHFYLRNMSKLGNRIESGDKVVNFVANLKNGLSIEDSAEMVDKYLFDYGDLSDFERNVMRRIQPFYTWISKNVPLQYEVLRDQPSYHRTIMKGLMSVNDQIPKEEQVDREYINDFAKNWVQLPGTVTNPDGTEEPIMFNPNLPYDDLDRLLGLLNPKDTAREIASRTTPALRIPYELATNRQIYFDQPIKAEDYDNSKRQHGLVQVAKDFIRMTQGQEPKQERIDPRLRYLHDQIPAWKNVGGFFEKSGADRVMHGVNHLGGLKFMSYDTERAKYFKMRDMLEKIRSGK